MEIMNFQTNVLNTQCLVCGTDALSNYVDLTLITSRTSHSGVPVREKLKTIVNDKWIASESNLSWVMCLSCFNLIDQFEALELQLKNIRDEVCEKYVGSHGIVEIVTVEDGKLIKPERNIKPRASTGTRGRRGAAAPKRQTAGRRKRGSLENTDCNIQTQLSQTSQNNATSKKNKLPEVLRWQQTPGVPFETNVEHLSDMPSSSQQLSGVDEQTMAIESGAGWKTSENGSSMCRETAMVQSQSTEHAVAQEEVEDANIYDDDPNVLNPGERLRVGSAMTAESNGISYSCGYCTDYFGDTETLKSHTRSHHQPEILTTQIPAHLGLGTKVNCGVQLANVTAINELAKPFVCLFCNGAFKFKSNIQLHYKEKHTPYKPFSCVDCHESFRRSMELSRHRVYYCPYRKKVRQGSEKKSK